MTAQEEQEYINLLEQEEASHSLISFTEKTWKGYVTNWHHREIAKALEDLVYQRDQRLMIFVPPRHGKSELVSRRYPAWRLGLDPDREIVIVAYSSTLANGFNDNAQSIMASEAYKNIFPDTVIPAVGEDTPMDGRKYKRNSSKVEVIGHRGSLYSVGVQGSFIGMGADDLLIDDPHKDVHEAHSETARDKVWDWWQGTAINRLEGGANVVLCQTRWHKDDLAGRLLDEMENGGEFAEKWKVIQFPAILEGDPLGADPRALGEVLWPYKYDKHALMKKRKGSGTRNWTAMYQQNPVIEGGNLIKEEWFRTYDELPKHGEGCMSWDLTFGSENNTASFVVGQVWVKSGPNFFMVDQVRKRMEFTEQIASITRFINQYPQCREILIEKKANGAAAINTLESKFNRLKAINPGKDKVQRLNACSPVFESGNVWLPRHAPWRVDYIEEMISFPASPNDDQVDTTTQMLNYWWDGGMSAIIVPTSIHRTSPWR